MNQRGRKVKHYKKEDIDNILYRYATENGSGLIKYMDVYRFANDLYLKKDINIKLSEDFWRKEGRQGRKAIDEVNNLYSKTIKKKKVDINYFADTELYIEKIIKASKEERRLLVDTLKINEKKAKEYPELLNKISSLEKELEHTKIVLEKEKIKTEEYIKILFSWFSASNKVEINLENMITTGKSKSKLVNMFFELMFSQADAPYYSWLTKDTNQKNENNVVVMQKNRMQKIIEKNET